MKNSVMTKKELDERILRRIPHSGSHHYDGILFLSTLFADRRRKKRKRSENFKYSNEQNRSVTIEGTPKEVIELENIKI